jgi:signal transduction histidine kinase
MSDNHAWWQNNIHPSDKKRIISDLHKLMDSTETVWWGRYLFRHKNGEYKPVLDRLYIVRGKAGNAKRLIGSMQDLSELILLQDQLVKERATHHNKMIKAIIQAEEEERMEISEELHENINQVLATINLHIGSAKKLDGEKDSLWKSEVQKLLSDSISGIRSIAKRLTPITLNSLGLKTALKELMKSILQHKKINFEIHADKLDESKLNKDLQLLVYRIAEHQIQNIRKHSMAKNCKLDITSDRGRVKIKIQDDGVGFDLEKLQYGKGFSNIQERSEAFGGSFKLSSDPGKGCILEVVFSDKKLTNRLIEV